MPDAYETSAAKLAANLAGFEAANEALQIMGGLGYTRETLVEYCLLRTRGWMIAGGSIEMLKNRIAESDLRTTFQPASRGGDPVNLAGTTAGVSRARLGPVLFHPASVALVGVSDDTSKTTGRPLGFLRRAKFNGAVYPVNRTRTRCRANGHGPILTALPEMPDHVFVMVPTAHVLDTVRECVELGCPVVTVLADGFVEDGEAGGPGADSPLGR